MVTICGVHFGIVDIVVLGAMFAFLVLGLTSKDRGSENPMGPES